MDVNDLLETIKKYRIISYPLIFIILDLTVSIVVARFTDYFAFSIFFLNFSILIGLLALYKLVTFYISPKRMEHKFNRFYANNFLSGFYRIFFPVFILGFIVQLGITFAWLSPAQGGLGLIDQEKISSSGFIALIVSSIVIGLGIIALSDYELKKKNILYSPQGKGSSKSTVISYILPSIGIYFGVTFFIRFVLTQTLGPGVLFAPESPVFEIDSVIVRASRFWQFLTTIERQLTLIAFVVIYIAAEIFLRGYMGNEAFAYGLGPAGLVFVPAIVQSFAFSNSVFLFRATVYYLYNLFELFFMASLLGIILWRTQRFSTVVITGLLMRLLDSRTDFQTTVLFMLPKGFGEYNPSDAITTIADTIGLYLIYFQISLVVISPFIIIVGYEELGNIFSNLYFGFKDQWFGYLVLGLGFFIIDLVFSFIFAIIGGFLAWIVAILIIGVVLSLFFKVLPPPLFMPTIHSETDMFEGEIPLDVTRDINYLERSKKWYENPNKVGILGLMGYLYFLFVSATYRQFTGLTGFEILKFVIFLIILPTLLISSSSYLMSRAYKNGYFFSENWRGSLFWILNILLIINILIWTASSSTVNFNWRNVPIILAFIILIWPKPLDNPTREFALGLARSGRYSTFRWVENHPDTFDNQFDELTDLPSENVKVGAYIIAAKLGLLEEWEIMEYLRSNPNDAGKIIGSIFALGIIMSQGSEGLILDYLDNDDLNIKAVSYWTLGRIGSGSSLRKMAKVLEENPIELLVKIGEKSILNIDPNFPLAGIRDSIFIEN